LTITYYAAALNPEGKIGQLLVTREMSAPGVCSSKKQEWTGVTYKDGREAERDLSRLNGAA
jgi:hypothetical protein